MKNHKTVIKLRIWTNKLKTDYPCNLKLPLFFHLCGKNSQKRMNVILDSQCFP